MKTIHDLERLVKEYMERHNLKYKVLFVYKDIVEAECFDLTKLEGRLTETGRVSFKVDGKRASIYK